MKGLGGEVTFDSRKGARLVNIVIERLVDTVQEGSRLSSRPYYLTGLQEGVLGEEMRVVREGRGRRGSK
jgi:hypothetical protein